jgi:hypothetical protein
MLYLAYICISNSMKDLIKNLAKMKTILQLNVTGASNLHMSPTPIRETEKAALYEFSNTRMASEGASIIHLDVWVPKSILTIDETTATIPAWFLNKNFGSFMAYSNQNSK